MMSGLAGASPAASLGGAKPIAVPLSMSSFAPDTLGRFGKYLDPMGFMPVPAGASSTSTTNAIPAAKEFAAGDAIGAVLLRGDFNVAATGTVTYIDGDRVYAFGHPFLDMGVVAFPMAKSEIVGVMPSLASSFKFANTGAVVGAFRQDRAVGIMGVMEKADMIPVDLEVEGSGVAQKYHVDVLRHSQLTPLILAMAADTVVASAQRAAGERTVMLESEIRIKGYPEPIVLREGWAGAQARQAIPSYLAVVAGYVMSNEFHSADIESVKIHFRHTDDLKIAKMLEASLEMPSTGRVHAGDTVKVRAVLKPYRGEAFVDTFEVKIPDDQAAGTAYLLVGSGSVLNQVDFMLVPPDPRSLDQVIAVLRRLRPSTQLTLGLYEQTDGAVTAGVYLPNLPPTMRAIVSSENIQRTTSSRPLPCRRTHRASARLHRRRRREDRSGCEAGNLVAEIRD